MAKKITYKLRLDDFIDTAGLTVDEKNRIKEETSELILDLVLKDTSNQRSAVSGQRWKGLSKEYKEIKSKVASGIANLELTGEMLDDVEARPYRDGIEFGVFGGGTLPRVENHNKTTARARRTSLPKRQFIPAKDESFRSGIMKEVTILAQEIIDESED